MRINPTLAEYNRIARYYSRFAKACAFMVLKFHKSKGRDSDWLSYVVRKV